MYCLEAGSRTWAVLASPFAYAAADSRVIKIGGPQPALFFAFHITEWSSQPFSNYCICWRCSAS
jgi:hypothetical protein